MHSSKFHLQRRSGLWVLLLAVNIKVIDFHKYIHVYSGHHPLRLKHCQQNKDILWVGIVISGCWFMDSCGFSCSYFRQCEREQIMFKSGRAHSRRTLVLDPGLHTDFNLVTSGTAARVTSHPTLPCMSRTPSWANRFKWLLSIQRVTNQIGTKFYIHKTPFADRCFI